MAETEWCAQNGVEGQVRHQSALLAEITRETPQAKIVL
jgi:hypothetical protein